MRPEIAIQKQKHQNQLVQVVRIGIGVGVLMLDRYSSRLVVSSIMFTLLTLRCVGILIMFFTGFFYYLSHQTDRHINKLRDSFYVSM